MKKAYYILAIMAILSAGFTFFSVEKTKEKARLLFEPDSMQIEEVKEPQYLYGLRIDSMVIHRDRIRKNQSLSDILLPRKVSHSKLFQLANNSREVFDVRKIKSGKEYTLLMTPDSTARKLIYEPNEVEYLVFHLDDSVHVEKGEKTVQKIRKSLIGTIDQSLAVTVEEQGGPIELTNKFVDAFAWQIDFFHLQKGDYFKVIYLEEQVDGKTIGVDQIEAIYFNHFGNVYWGFAYDQGEGIDFFDEDGASLRKALLKYPLEFTRISSKFTLSRFHPVQKRWKAHRGTDFSARTGTKIRSVGDGIVTEATYKRWNGNYVKIRHNSTYTTQYLHMSKIASGIKAGVKVKQGQLIGFVGSTGLATGPHLCYRFWKNGVQVDALKVELPPSNPIREEQMKNFTEVKNKYIELLDANAIFSF